METPPVQTPAMVRWFLLGVALWASVAWPAEVQSRSVRATVLSIGDGDTIRVRQAGRDLTVRLACIDAPETAQSPWGQQARRYLQQRLPIGREVTLEVKTTDRYGRTVAEGTVAELMRRTGQADFEETFVRLAFAAEAGPAVGSAP